MRTITLKEEERHSKDVGDRIKSIIRKGRLPRIKTSRRLAEKTGLTQSHSDKILTLLERGLLWGTTSVHPISESLDRVITALAILGLSLEDELIHDYNQRIGHYGFTTQRYQSEFERYQSNSLKAQTIQI